MCWEKFHEISLTVVFFMTTPLRVLVCRNCQLREWHWPAWKTACMAGRSIYIQRRRLWSEIWRVTSECRPERLLALAGPTVLTFDQCGWQLRLFPQISSSDIDLVFTETARLRKGMLVGVFQTCAEWLVKVIQHCLGEKLFYWRTGYRWSEV